MSEELTQDNAPQAPRPNNAALQFEPEEEEDGWDDDDFDLSETMAPPAPPAQAQARQAGGARRQAPSRSMGVLDVDTLNDPDLIHLGPTPMIGGTSHRGSMSDMFGEQAAHVMGRATSPKIYGQVAQFPTCTQLRVWKIENGVPVGLGPIDAQATEEDFVRKFHSAMPRKGEGKAQFAIRPIDVRGESLGQEATVFISEHHDALRAMREAAEEDGPGGGGGMFPFFGGRFGGMQQSSGSDEMARELTGMVEHMLATADQRARTLEDTLEAERERMRQEELERTRERVDLATNAAQGVQAVTERLMQDESRRAERAAKAQEQQSNMLVTTLTTVFSQQQQAMQAQAAEQRRADEFRLQQERQRAEEERRFAQERVRMEREESDRKRQQERDEMEARLRREREEAEQRWKLEQIRMERDREDRKMEMERAKEEARLRYEQQKAEATLRMQQDRERLERDRMEHERKLQQEREEAERRLRLEMERLERDRMERREAVERERAEREDKARRESEEGKLRDIERQRQHERLLEEAKLTAQQQREHAERMMALQKLELEKKSSAGGLEMLAQFGLDPKDILPRLFNVGGRGAGDDDEDDDEGSEGGWAENIPKILGVAAEMLKGRGAAGSQAVAAQQAAARPAPIPTQRRIPPMTPDFQQQQFEHAMRQQATQTAPRPVMQQPQQPQQPQQQQQPQQAAPRPPQQPIKQATPPHARSNKEKAKAAGMDLKGIRSARKGLQRLVRRVSKSPQTKWEEIITAGVMQAPAIYDYIKAITVQSAILEGGADPKLCAQVIQAMRESALVPNDLPFGDAQ